MHGGASRKGRTSGGEHTAEQGGDHDEEDGTEEDVEEVVVGESKNFLGRVAGRKGGWEIVGEAKEGDGDVYPRLGT